MAIYVRCQRCRTDIPLKAVSGRDPRCRNCGAPIPSKGRTYKVVVKYGTRKVVKMVPHSLELARELEAKIKTGLIEGTYLDKKKEAPKLDEVWKRYLEEIKETRKGWDRDLNRYQVHLEPRFGKKALDAISPMDVQRMIVELKKAGKSPKTIRNIAELLNRLYNYARRMDLYEGENPLERVTLPKVSNRVVEYLTPDQIRRLWHVCRTYPDRQAADLILLALLTGCRRGELFRLKWEDVDLEGGWMILRNPKGGRDQVIPLNRLAVELLRNHPRVEGSPYVFPGKGGGQRVELKSPWVNIRKLAGLPRNFRFHGLRHTYATCLASSGQVPLQVIQRLLTHQSPEMTQRYAHLVEETLRKGAQAMEEIMRGILTEADPSGDFGVGPSK